MAVAQRARYSVQVAWDQGSIGLFTFDRSTFNSSIDKLAATRWSAIFSGTYDDITNPGDGTHVDRIGIVRGREDDLSAMRAGEATIEISDWTGKFNAKNVASPLYGKLTPNRPVRVSATYGGITYPLYYGFTDRIEFEPHSRRGIATIHAVDLFTRLNEQSSAFANPGVTTAGAMIGLILDAMQWTEPAMRRLGVGATIPGFPTVADNLLNRIEQLLEADRGCFFIGADGAAVFVSRDERARLERVATIADVMKTLVVATDIANVVNRWTINRESLTGTAISSTVVSDQTSIDRYGFHDDQITTALIPDDNKAVNLGAYLLSKTAQPLRPVWKLPLRANIDASTMALALGRDLCERVQITESKGGTSGDYFIEQIQHQIELGGLMHETTWGLSERPTVATLPFRFGSSQMNGTDRLDYYP